MLQEITKFDSFGSYDEITYLVKEVISSKTPSIKDIHLYCLSNYKFRVLPVDSILSLLRYINIIEITKQKVSLTQSGHSLLKSMDNSIIGKGAIISLIIDKINGDSKLIGFIDLDAFKFDSLNQIYTLRNSSIPLKYAGIKNLLINLEFFQLNSQFNNLLIVNDKLLNKFLPQFKETHRKKTYDEFKKNQEILERIGEEAEKFVLAFEKRRLIKHPHNENIMRISDIDINAGYDIVSFNDEKSRKIDRYIEVKSYTGDISFYWSRNEIMIAKQKRGNYFLYLIDRLKTAQEDYVPLIINDPYHDVFDNTDWAKESTTWFIQKQA